MCLLFSVHLTLAQPTEKQIKVQVSADHADWLYKPGEKVNFSIVVSKNGSPIPQVKIRYEIGPEKQDPWKKETQVLANGSLQVDGGTLSAAGFLRCVVIAEVEGKGISFEVTFGDSTFINSEFLTNSFFSSSTTKAGALVGSPTFGTSIIGPRA